MGIGAKRSWALVVGVGVGVIRLASGVAGAEQPVQVPPFQVPTTMVVGRSYTVPAPCDLGANQELQYEYDPMFTSPTYYTEVIPGPAAPDGTIVLPVPETATPGTYTLRGWCRAVGALPSEELEIEPVTVELTAGGPPIVATTVVPTTAPDPDAAPPITGQPGFTG